MSGYHVFQDMDILTAAQVNSYLMSQTVPRFASTGTRDAAIPAPETGQMCYVTGIGLMTWSGTAWGTGTGGFSASVELSSAAPSMSVGSIPRTLKQLRLTVMARADNTTPYYQQVSLRFGGDSGNNYGYALSYQSNTAYASPILQANANAVNIGWCPSSLSGQDRMGSITVTIPGWNLPNGRPSGLQANFQGGFIALLNAMSAQGVCEYVGTAALTSVSVQPGSGNFVAGSQFLVQGSY